MRQLNHRDLGVRDNPVLLFGGPYSNVHATQALIAEAARRAIPASDMICTGDLVAYAGDPAQTVAMIRALGCPVVAGNCELQLASGAQDCGCGYEEGSSCDVLSVQWFNYALEQIDQDAKNWMGDLPDVISFTHRGARYGVIHGGVEDVAAFNWRTNATSAFDAEWDALDHAIGKVDHIIAGHTGMTFIKSTARGTWINAGVIGMPPHDGQPHTRYAVLENGEVSFHPLAYDAQAAAARMAEVGLPPDYARSLITGYWPSEDILPIDLRAPSLAKG